ncbi:MAG: methionine--tRNA ligase [Candidatus Neomarinimicrobiota bacterium]|nr:MAG: methionine--tRNA ligase [Candidatus Neomarinimicrobiota bacterium]
MGKRFYVTTPLYYVNDQPHIGHTYSTIIADILARYHRMRGEDTHFLTGTDEHGQKVQQAAAKAGIPPEKHCNEYARRFRSFWDELGLTYNDFIRTTETRHTRVVQKILQDLYDKGDIYKDKYEGLYSVAEERFITRKEYEEGNFREVKEIHEINYFFRMSAYQKDLIAHIESHPGFIQPENRKNEILGFLQQPLNDLCISRPKNRLSWGIELPFDREYVTYVWFDALINYISAVGFSRDDALFRKWWPAVHIIGKDILTTHCVYWPTMLMAAGVPLPETIFAHGWWMSEGQKMSKSLGNFIDLNTIRDHVARVGTDAFRYFLAKEGPLFGDSDFSKDRFYQTYNTDLANDFGNLVNRILKLIHKYFDAKVPTPGKWTETEIVLQKEGKALQERVFYLLDRFELNRLIFEILSYIRSINRYLEQKAPWKLAKTDLEQTGTVLYSALASLRMAAGLMDPILPEKVAQLYEILNEKVQAGQLPAWDGLKPGTPVLKTEGLFPRIDLAFLQDDKREEKAVRPEKDEKIPEDQTGLISLEDFQKIRLQTARILEAEVVRGTEKLMKLTIKTGSETRTLVAGIVPYYKPEELIGKTIVIVANLQPATIRGIRSKGMLLAARSKDMLRLVTLDGDLPESGVVIK